MDVENKTSDEILQELFSALNVPLSPKVKEEQPSENQGNSLDSEGSEDKEADSKSSESEDESKGQEEQITKNHKHKTSKKKKEKKKKKKKHKKKDDDGRHKSKKKHRKVEESPPVVKVQKVEVKLEEVVTKIADVIVEQTEECVSNNEVSKVEVKGEELTKDPCPTEEVNKTLSQNGKRKSDTNSDSGDKEDTSKKPTKKSKSPLRSHSSSKSLRSRSRSPSKVRHRHSRSRSHQGRHSRSKSRQGRHSRSRSHSRSKHGSRHSRSSSRKKSSSHKSKAKSPAESDRLKHRRKSSRSRSRSYSPRSSKRRRYSKSRSRSPSSKNAKRKFSRSHSKSLSPKYSRRKRYRSPSSSPVKVSKRRSRSRSGSHKKVVSKEISDTLTKATESSSKVETSKNAEKSLEIDLSSIPTPDVQQPLCPATLPISLESIPLPVPPISTEVQDPSSIPLPQPVVPGKEQLNGKDHSEDKDKEIDLGTIPVPGYVSETAMKEQEPLKPTDTGVEKSKAKTIIIKSLKDSLIYMQAQEEAERRAKVKQNDDEEVSEKNVEKSNGKLEDTEMKDQKTESKAEEEEEEEEEATEESVKEPEEEESSVPKKSTNGDQYEVDEGEVVVKNGNEVEDGEIVSENDNEETSKTKSHKKKSKKDKDKSKEKKKSKREKSKEKKKQAKERSKSKERSVKSRSKSKERSKHRKSSSWHRDRDADRRYRRYSRSRSHSRDRHSRFRRRSYSRSRSRSRSRSGRKGDCVSDLRDKVTRKRLLEIARRNAVYLMQNGCLPPSVEQEQLVKIKTGGKSVEELTDFCKQLVASGNYSDAELSDPSPSSDEDDNNPDKPFSCTRHPFSVRDSKPILMNIRNAPMLPTKTNAERLADHAKLREQFPVSSGSQHRNKGEVNTTEDKLRTDSGWVPVSPKEKNKKEEDSVFSKEKAPAVDISQIVSSRLSAMRKLQDNPNDMEALKTLHNVQKDMQTWALSKQEPGQFTGSTGVKILSQEELSAGQQAWVRKEQFKEAAPVRPQFGLKMLQKMGWTPGEGLGKNKEGAIEPLLLDVKMDKKGFHAQEELTPKKQPIPMAKDLSGKHPVSALVELCSKHKWQPPEFEMVFDYGPDHKKNFLMKVKVNGQEYKPAVAGPTKKLAKANAAAACLQSLGLLTKDPENPLTEAS
ncbi:protein Son-like isoform X2 [Macrobrachium rosenbergii]|uniref:protein Son-like isoform X2 n=1 Tax=Macrobrachium rosenbergii TaxID=79674 RepID=UPI0034D7B9B1